MPQGSGFTGVFLLFVFAVLGVSACAPALAPAPTPTKPPAPSLATPTPAGAGLGTPTVAAKPSPAAQGTAPARRLSQLPSASPMGVSDAGVFLGVERGCFKDLGLDVRLETFTAGTLVIAPLGTGELEVAGSGSIPGLLNAIDRGLALKVVADKGYAISGRLHQQGHRRGSPDRAHRYFCCGNGPDGPLGAGSH